MTRVGIRMTCIVLCFILGGCRVGPNYRRPTASIPGSYSGAIASEVSSDSTPSVATLEWQRIFPDPALSSLISKAMTANLDLKIAAQRVLEAQAYLGTIKSEQYPSVSGGGSYVALQLPENLGQALNGNQFIRGGGPSASAVWNLDFWGLYRRQTEAARAEMLSNVWAQRAVQVTVIESIAEAYFNLRSLDEQIEITNRTISTRESSTKLVALLANGGFSSVEDLRQAEESLHEAKANLPALRQAAAVQEHLLSFLVGGPPTQIERGRAIEEQPRPEALPVGLPSELLERRPDIGAAEQKLVAGNARIGVARAKYFPNISLTALGGTTSNQLNQVLKDSSAYWLASGSITEPIFDAGKIRSENRFARAQKVELENSYQRTILNALRETSDAVVAYGETHIRRQELEQQVTAANEALRLANLRYQAGDTSYLEVLIVQTDLYNAQLSLTRSNEAEASSLARVYAALGGGWR